MLFVDLSAWHLQNLAIREQLNGGLLPLNLCLVGVIGMFLWHTWRRFGHDWTRIPGVRTACALFWIFAADAARAGFVWLILRMQNRGGTSELILHVANFGFVIAAFAGLIAILRCVYLFTPKAWGHWGWIGSAGVTAAFLALSMAL